MYSNRLLSRALLFIFRVLCFPLRAGSTGEDNLDGSTPQLSPRVQIPPPTRKQEELDGLHLGEYSSELTAGNKTERVLITHVRATNVAIRLRRIPVGFYVVVKTENRTQRTSNKPASVSKDMVEWDDEIVLPMDRSSKISLAVFASFELGRLLGDGEVVSEFETTVDHLLYHNKEFELIRFVEPSDEVDSPLCSLEVEIEWRTCGWNDSHTVVSDPPESEDMHELVELTQRGHHALLRYRKHREQQELDESVKCFEHAQDLCPPDHPSRATVLFNLANAKSIHCRVHDGSPDLDTPINLYRDVLRLCPRGHPDHPFSLLSLGVVLAARSQRQQDEENWAEGNLILSQVLDIAPADSYTYHAAVLALGSTAEPKLIQPKGIPKTFGNHNDSKVRRLDAALQRTSHPDSWKHVLLDHLGILLCLRFNHLADFGDPERAISMLEVVVQFTPSDHPDKPSWLGSLGGLFSTRYKRFGDVVDLERSISLRENVVQLTPDGHPDAPVRLNNLGHSLLARYRRFGDVTDLDRSISLREDVLQFTPDGHPDRPLRLTSLGNSLSTRYEHFGNVVDLERSISLEEDAVKLTHDEHPVKPSRLMHLGRSISARYKRFGDIVDLKRLISLLEDAMQVIPDGHPNKPTLLNNLGDSFSTRYQHFGDVSDLERSISLREDAVKLTPDGHRAKPSRLNNLGDSFSARYEHFGDLADLERSISLFKDALQFAPDGDPNKHVWLSNLGYSLSARYGRFRDAVDLKRSISLFEDAAQLTPDGHPNKPTLLSNLGDSFSIRYRRFGDITDLERSISLRENAVQLTPDGHPDKPLRLHNLGDSLSTRYKRFGDINDLERSISSGEDAIQFTPDDHPRKPAWLNNLALSLLDRFQRFGNLSNSDLSWAILYSSRAARSPTGSSVRRFNASQTWIRCTRLLGRDDQSILDACAVAVDLLPQLAWMGLSINDRCHQLLQAADGSCDAAAAALEAHKPALAIEWLEQGRSIVWSQFSQFRTPVNDLRFVYPDLAAQFERISRDIEYASVRDREAILGGLTVHLDIKVGELEKEARQHHTLALSRERLLAEIRALPGFERFLLPKTIQQLSSLANSGPVVFLNACKHRCDALVVMAGSEDVIHVPLSDTDYDEVVSMQLRLNQLLSLKGRVVLCSDNPDRGARVKGVTADDVFRSILPYLWKKIVNPILVALPLSISDGKLPRIFWCPTGPFSFLPIHAAGLYSTANPGPKLSDFAISSYLPTMGALELSPQDDSEATSRNIRLLAVPQPSTDGQAQLNGVRGEIEIVRKLASSLPFVALQEADGTVEDVLSKMEETDWVHFACHGTQDRTNPYDSGFLLAHGKRLKLPDITRLSRRHGGLAFLSACHTATGDDQLPGEAIHIAAGMLLAGYRSVIATMWSILDNDAPRVTEDVYKSLFSGDGKVPDSRQAAEALHDAIERLRDSGAPFLSWVPFVHVGL